MGPAGRILQLAFVALIMALAGLWSPTVSAHQAHHAAHGVACAELHGAADVAPMRGATRGDQATSVGTLDQRAASHGAACGSGCCAGGASCASPIAGPPAASLGLPDPERPEFGLSRVPALATRQGERLPKPPRG